MLSKKDVFFFSARFSRFLACPSKVLSSENSSSVSLWVGSDEYLRDKWPSLTKLKDVKSGITSTSSTADSANLTSW